MHRGKEVSHIGLLVVTMSLFPISPACSCVCGWESRGSDPSGLLTMTKSLFVGFLSLSVVRGTSVQCGEEQANLGFNCGLSCGLGNTGSSSSRPCSLMGGECNYPAFVLFPSSWNPEPVRLFFFFFKPPLVCLLCHLQDSYLCIARGMGTMGLQPLVRGEGLRINFLSTWKYSIP